MFGRRCIYLAVAYNVMGSIFRGGWGNSRLPLISVSIAHVWSILQATFCWSGVFDMASVSGHYTVFAQLVGALVMSFCNYKGNQIPALCDLTGRAYMLGQAIGVAHREAGFPLRSRMCDYSLLSYQPVNTRWGSYLQ